MMPALMAEHEASYRLGPVKLTLARLDEDVVRDVKPALVALPAQWVSCCSSRAPT